MALFDRRSLWYSLSGMSFPRVRECPQRGYNALGASKDTLSANSCGHLAAAAPCGLNWPWSRAVISRIAGECLWVRDVIFNLS